MEATNEVEVPEQIIENLENITAEQLAQLTVDQIKIVRGYIAKVVFTVLSLFNISVC